MSLDVEINSKQYSLVPSGDGSKISTRPVQQFVQPIRDTGRTRPEDVAAYESFVVPNLAYGFGRARVNSDVAFDPKEYRRFFNSTCDTRWMDRIYLPILAETPTQSGINVVKCSTSFKEEINSLWSVTPTAAGATGGVINRQYTGASDTWENGGYLQAGVAPSTSSVGAGAGLTIYTVQQTVPVGTDLLVFALMLTDNASTSGSWTQVKWNTASNGDGGTAMTQAVSYNNGATTAAIWYLANPTAATSYVSAVPPGSINADEINSALYMIKGANVDALSVGTQNTGISSTTAVSSTVTTVANDIVIDAVALSDNESVSSSGSGQVVVTSANGASVEHRHISSYRNATTTSTAMTHTLGGNGSGAGVAAAFATHPTIPIDITSYEGNLVAMAVTADDQRTFTSTDGASWAESTTQITKALLDDNKTVDENVDAGLFATIGGELIATVWDEVSSSITFFRSTNGGVAWADETVEIPSANGPQGVAVYMGIDGEDKLYVATHEGIYEVDTSPSTWTFQLIVPMSNSNDNGRRMTVHSGSLWFAQGVDNDSPAPIYRMTVQGNSRIIQSGYGLDVGDGVPEDMLGPVRFMKSTGDQLFISIGGGAASRKARILSWSNTGWHHMTRNTTANQKIEWLDVGSGDDGVPRLHFANRTATSAATAKFLEQPLVNPRSGVSIKREDDADGVTGYVDLPYIDLGMPHENKNFLRTHVNGEDLNSSASDEYITIEYGTDDAARTTTDLGSYTSATTVNSFVSNAGVSGKNIGMRVNFLRGSTNTNTPKLKDLIVEGMIVPGNGNLSYQHEITIDIDQTATATGLSTESVYSNLKTLLATVTQVDFEFGAESRKVTVDRDNSAFLTYLDEYGYASSPNSMASRSGILRLVLVERIPLS